MGSVSLHQYSLTGDQRKQQRVVEMALTASVNIDKVRAHIMAE